MSSRLKSLLLSLFSIGLLASSMLSAPTMAAPSAPITLQFWHSMTGEKGKLLDGIIDDFNHLDENKGKLTVQSQFIGSYEEGLNKLRTALIGGRGPDVVQITDIGTQVMIDSDSIVPLQDFIDRDPEFPIAQILPPIRHYYEVAGKLYSLPFATSNPILYYNEDAFKKAGITHPPATYAELEEDALKLSSPADKITGITWPLNSWFFEEFLAREGVALVNPNNGRGTRAKGANYLDPAAIAFVSLWERMTKNQSFGNVGRGWDPPEANFLAGRSAMLITSTSDIFENLSEAPFKMGTAPIPSASAKSPGGTIVGGNSLWIMKNKPIEEQNGAYRFIKYMASAKVQETWHKHTGYFPIRADVIDNLKKQGFYDKYPVAWVAIQQVRSSPDLPATRGALMGIFPEVREHVATAIEEVISGQATVEQALKKAKAKTDFSLLRYNRGKSE
jgi:sn-glycerol 3-phosphate transport system substrate-binding protein